MDQAIEQASRRALLMACDCDAKVGKHDRPPFERLNTLSAYPYQKRYTAKETDSRIAIAVVYLRTAYTCLVYGKRAGHPLEHLQGSSHFVGEIVPRVRSFV